MLQHLSFAYSSPKFASRPASLAISKVFGMFLALSPSSCSDLHFDACYLCSGGDSVCVASSKHMYSGICR